MRTHTYACLAALLAALAPVSAIAQEQEVVDEPDEPMPDPEPAVEPAPAAAAPAPLGVVAAVAPPAILRDSVDIGQLEDSNIDRGFLLPTAQTQPRGSVTFQDYQLLIMGLAAGVTDDFQVGAMVMVPIGELIVGQVSAKYRLLRYGRLRLAAQGSAVFIRVPDLWEGDEVDDSEVITLYTAGGIASYCLDAKCGSTLSASATTGWSADTDSDSDRPVIFGASLVKQLNRRTKLLLEYLSAAEHDPTNGWSRAEGGFVNYGIRFFSSEISGDVGFIKPFGLDDDDDTWPIGLPFLNFTYRAL